MTVLEIVEGFQELCDADQQRAAAMVMELGLKKFGKLIVRSEKGMPVTGSFETPEKEGPPWRQYLFRSGEFRRGYYYKSMSWEHARAAILSTFPPGSNYNPDTTDYYQGWLHGQ